MAKKTLKEAVQNVLNQFYNNSEDYVVTVKETSADGTKYTLRKSLVIAYMRESDGDFELKLISRTNGGITAMSNADKISRSVSYWTKHYDEYMNVKYEEGKSAKDYLYLVEVGGDRIIPVTDIYTEYQEQ